VAYQPSLLAGWQANKPDLVTERPLQIGVSEQEDIITVYNTSIIIIIIISISIRYKNEEGSSTPNGATWLSVTEQNYSWQNGTIYTYSGVVLFME